MTARELIASLLLLDMDTPISIRCYDQYGNLLDENAVARFEFTANNNPNGDTDMSKLDNVKKTAEALGIPFTDKSLPKVSVSEFVAKKEPPKSH